ncbi:L-aminopeptidase/D-esterase [Poseidonocella pacifica]|uniref:L-aminopeptidase/D-esterase n=1 Tax=Poseidonocella pacifica TaxID=871651 RepID=A0A1I0WD12_9RHOB|nr:P1 family peptidase [Poseidonocella pacifica]SFA86138.1 L-aminopeptidase/D-esterase [Poseidonocella pacifica]
MDRGARNLITDVPGLLVGNASDPALKSGVTVLTSTVPFVAGVSIMGGAPGTRETELLAPDKTVQEVDAIVLSGGSAFGLAACDGVSDGLVAAGRGFAVGPVRVPIVPGAILFDLLNGGAKDWTANPYPALGRAAFDAAAPDFALGSEGAGTGATTATFKGGLGSTSCRLPNGTTVAALVAVNALGSATVGEGREFWAAPWEEGQEFGGIGPASHYPKTIKTKLGGQGANTTIAIVATDAALTQAQCTRVATAAHDGMARALLPSHTPLDGDLIFAVSTGSREVQTPPEDLLLIGHTASICLARAIARGVFSARPAPGDVCPVWSA